MHRLHNLNAVSHWHAFASNLWPQLNRK
ncbi:UNVERIFIED_CONTAM: hypothetical protein GTU68_050447 [Idotea baltica]|nr:hypothetical protein [Idotea baltica]